MFFIVQVLDDGRPFLDMAHVITNLNRLDAGIPDTVGGGGGGVTVNYLLFNNFTSHYTYFIKEFGKTRLLKSCFSFSMVNNLNKAISNTVGIFKDKKDVFNDQQLLRVNCKQGNF